MTPVPDISPATPGKGETQLDSAEVARLLEGAQARRGDDLRPDSRAGIAARLRAGLLEQIRERNDQLRTRYGYVGGLMVLAGAKDDVPHLLAAIEALSTALQRHREWFTDSKGVMLCGGCLKPVPCPDDPDMIVERALSGKEAGDE